MNINISNWDIGKEGLVIAAFESGQLNKYKNTLFRQVGTRKVSLMMYGMPHIGRQDF